MGGYVAPGALQLAALKEWLAAPEPRAAPARLGIRGARAAMLSGAAAINTRQRAARP